MTRLSITIAALALALPSLVHATPNFPKVIEDEVGTAGPPPCSVCHQADVTNNYSVKTPFGAALKARGLVPENDASLRTALKMLRSDAADSDHDGVADVDELEAGEDPNIPGDGPAGPDLSYGCATRSIGAGGPGALRAVSWSVAAWAGLVWLARKRGRDVSR